MRPSASLKQSLGLVVEVPQRRARAGSRRRLSCFVLFSFAQVISFVYLSTYLRISPVCSPLSLSSEGTKLLCTRHPISHLPTNNGHNRFYRQRAQPGARETVARSQEVPAGVAAEERNVATGGEREAQGGDPFQPGAGRGEGAPRRDGVDHDPHHQ